MSWVTELIELTPSVHSLALAALANLLLVDAAIRPGNPDSHNGAEVFALIREIREDTGVAVVMVTHDDRLARQAQRILSIIDGYVSKRDHNMRQIHQDEGHRLVALTERGR